MGCHHATLFYGVLSRYVPFPWLLWITVVTNLNLSKSRTTGFSLLRWKAELSESHERVCLMGEAACQTAEYFFQNSALPEQELAWSSYNFNSLEQCLRLKAGANYLQCSQISKVRRKRNHRKYFTGCLQLCTGQYGSWEKRKDVSVN